jgi:hypothetical protein
LILLALSQRIQGFAPAQKELFFVRASKQIQRIGKGGPLDLSRYFRL